MDCKKAEWLLLGSFDGAADDGSRAALEAHLAGCPDCRAKASQYGLIRDVFKSTADPGPLPYFRQRVLARLNEQARMSPVRVWLKWAHAAAAASLAALILFGAGVLLFQPREPVEMSQLETLFYRNENPLSDAASVLNQTGAEDKGMMLIYASADLSRR
jgi:hypothetical protein